MSSDENSENIIYGCGSATSEEPLVSKLHLDTFYGDQWCATVNFCPKTDDNLLITHDD